MHMNAYVERVIESVRQKHGTEPDFVQTVEEVLSSLSPVIDKHPEYEKADLLGRIVEPERMFTFRVVWMDDNGAYHTNIGYRCQFNGAIGPYKGGLRFQKNVYPGIGLAGRVKVRTALAAADGKASQGVLTLTRPASPMPRLCVSARAI